MKGLTTMKTLTMILATAFLATISLPAAAGVPFGPEHPCYEKLTAIFKKVKTANNLAWASLKKTHSKVHTADTEKFCVGMKEVERLELEWRSMLTPACCPNTGVYSIACVDKVAGLLKDNRDMRKKYCTKH
jgi:hypothetical protein